MSLPFLNRTPHALHRTTEWMPHWPRRHIGVVVVRQLKHDLTSAVALNAAAVDDDVDDFLGLGAWCPSDTFALPPSPRACAREGAAACAVNAASAARAGEPGAARVSLALATSTADAWAVCEGREGDCGGELGTERETAHAIRPLEWCVPPVPLALSLACRLASLRSNALMWCGWLVCDDTAPPAPEPPPPASPVGDALVPVGPIAVPVLDID